MKPFVSLLGLSLFGLSGALAAPMPLGTAFSYQGKLFAGTNPVTGNYDFQFKLYNDATAGAQIGSTYGLIAQPVSAGLFAVTLDFGAGAIVNETRWLEICVRTNDASATFLPLTPRQSLTPAPFALWTATAATAALSTNVVAGAIAATHLATPTNPCAGQILSYDGANLAWTSPPGGWGPSWLLGGNTGTSPGGNFLGTLDNQPLQLRVNGILGWLLQPTDFGNVTIVGGAGSSAAPGVDGGTIGGGYGNKLLDAAHNSTIAGGNQNTIGANTQLATIGGGGGNTISSNSWYAAIASGQGNAIGAGVGGGVISGGSFNTLYNGASSSVIGGGGANTIGTGAAYDAIGGGSGNQIASAAWYSTVVGGTVNIASNSWVTLGGGEGNVAFGPAATIVGGQQNVVTGTAGAIGGGYQNLAAGDYSTIGGGQTNVSLGANSVIGGGYENLTLGLDSTVAGGAGNAALANYSAIGGGTYNQTFDTGAAVGGGKANYAGYYATIAGGLQNTATNFGAIAGGYGNHAFGYCSAVVGGYTNEANGAYSFAAGRRAKAVHDGAFVWADTTDADFRSTAANQFAIRATGGVLVQAGTNNFELASGGIKVTGAGVGTATPVFIHKAATNNISGHITTIYNPQTDGNPNALLFVTHNWSMDNMYETHPLGVWYNGMHWTIFHEDIAAMPAGMAFNVTVIKP